MRLISLLVGLAIIALIASKQLHTSPEPVASKIQPNRENPETPKVTTTPEGVNQFGTDMDKYLQSTEAKRKKQIEEALDQ